MTITVGLIDSAAVSLNDPVLFEDPDLHNNHLLNGPDTSLFNNPPFFNDLIYPLTLIYLMALTKLNDPALSNVPDLFNDHGLLNLMAVSLSIARCPDSFL